MSSNLAPIVSATEAGHPDIPEARTFSPATSTGRARDIASASATSRHSSATILARKAAANARLLRRRLEYEEERERHLAELRRQVEETELQAELAAIDAEYESRTGSHHGSTRVSVERTERWVQDQHISTLNKSSLADDCRQVAALPDRSAIPPTVPAPLVDRTAQQQQQPCVLKPSNVEGENCPYVSTMLDTNQNAFNSALLNIVADTAAAAKALASQTKSQLKLELFPFSGNVLQWLQFKRIFYVTKTAFSPLENLARLRNALRGPALEAVAALLLSTEDPEEVMQALEENFARPEFVVFQEVASLKSLPRLGDDLKELGCLCNRVRNSVSTIKLLNQLEYLHSPELFHAVLGKLNPTMNIRWTDFAVLDSTGRPKLEILSDFLNRELDQHIRFGLSPESSSIQKQHVVTIRSQKNENVNLILASKSDPSKRHDCSFCQGDHNIKSCSKFKSLSIEERWQWLREAKICYRCLKRKSHQWKTCKVNPCGLNGCTFRHHPLLHQNPPQSYNNYDNTQSSINTITEEQNYHSSPNSLQVPEEKVVVSTTSTDVQQPSLPILALRPRAYLKIVPIIVSGPTGSCNVFALLDDGSTATLIDSSVAEQIGVSGPQQKITVNGIGGLERTTTVSYVNFHVKGKYTHETFLVKNARSMVSLSLRPQTIQRESISSYSHLTDLTDMLLYEDATPTVLIGAEHWHLSINRDVRIGRKNEPVACLTALGWTLYGSSSSKTKLVEFVNHTSFNSMSEDTDLEFLIREQYKLDSLGIFKKETLHCQLDQRAVEILENTSKRLASGRFEVGMPWRDGITMVPDSYSQAMSRFLSLERRMANNSDFHKDYDVFMTNMVMKGYAEECASETFFAKHRDDNKHDKIRLYLPHFGVFHPQKRKLRVVHDAAAMNEGVSLNSLLLPGPDLLQSLLKILFRFREGCIAMLADIKEMFPQIRIREQDRDALRYLWRSNKHEPLKEFRMTAVIFGACCSPFIAQFIKNKNAREHAQQYPKAVEAILFNHYMDDYIDSLDNVNEAAQLAADIISVHSAACFEMRAWISNESAALKLVPEHLRAAPPLEIDLGDSSDQIRALGIAWSPTTDVLGFRTGLSKLTPEGLTKRKVLSHLMRVYDPLGLLGPVIIKGRILFQQAWRSNLGWDTELPRLEASKWLAWFQELSTVSTLKIPRWYSRSKDCEPSYRELHLFADASELAYACVAYWRLVYHDRSVRLALICSKARVAPLKPISIPRLELQAALIASRLALTVKNGHRKKPVNTFFWTDSMTVLQWLRSDSRTFKPFVAHRLGEISENSCVKDWRWVPTDLNVADDATRVRPISLNLSHRWFSGPSFLLNSSEDWPLEPLGVPLVCEELKSQPYEAVGATAVTNLPAPVTANFDRFSDWTRLLRATARIYQAVANFKTLLATHQNSPTSRKAFHIYKKTASTTLTPLDAKFIRIAENQILQRTQLECFSEEFYCILNSKPIPPTSHLIKLSPILGDKQLLRLAGRIKAVEDIDPDTRFPVLLHGGHKVVRLLVQNYHRRAGHANNESVVNQLRQRFWLIKLRDTVRSVARNCLLCKMRKGQPMNPVTGDLPPERLAHHQRPFTFTGVDYFGPITVTIGRRHEKRYVALFTCLTVRALHLELVHSLSSDSAIMGLRRFISRRGTPNTIFSDNGTAFVGANRILKEFYSTEIQEFTASKGITWSFIPAAAPHFGGCWERLVRSVKVALQATLKERTPKEETLITILAEAEAIVNSRPLTHVSTDPEDPTTLTPFHFLIGSSSDQILPSSLDDQDLSRRVEWRKALRLADHFWSRWVKEILPTMQPRNQTRGNRGEDLKIGEVVQIVDGTLPRGSWPRGRIMQAYPGKDGVIRVVDVATPGGVLRRPLRKLVRITN